MELNAAVHDRYGNLSLPMLRIIDCYSARIRRLFRLPGTGLSQLLPCGGIEICRRERPERTVLGDVAVQGDAVAPDADH
jgi:hypothetical protein